jgi:hypothetical protein
MNHMNTETKIAWDGIKWRIIFIQAKETSRPAKKTISAAADAIGLFIGAKKRKK